MSCMMKSDGKSFKFGPENDPHLTVDETGVSFHGSAPAAKRAAYTQAFSTADKTHAARSAAALTDNSTGAVGVTIAAGVGVATVAIPVNLATVVDGDVLTTYTPGYKFKILGVDFAVTQEVTTADKATSLNVEIGATNLTGGVVALTSANCAVLGAVVAGTAVTAENAGAADATISIEAASTTAFAEGSGVLLLKIQNMDTADAIASLADQIGKNRVDSADTASVVNSVVDDLQALGLVG